MHHIIIVVAACLYWASGVPAKGQETFDVTVLKVLDGDTVIIDERCSRFDNKTLLRVRVYGIDTPESKAPPAKCDREVALGKEASAFAKTLIKPGTSVKLTYRAKDRWGCRIVASITLPDGRDFADVMIQAGYARPYGLGHAVDRLTKSDWCN